MPRGLWGSRCGAPHSDLEVREHFPEVEYWSQVLKKRKDYPDGEREGGKECSIKTALVLYRYITNHSKTWWLKTTRIIPFSHGYGS